MAHSNEFPVPLIRRAIKAQRTATDEVVLQQEAEESVDASQEYREINKVREDLLSRILELPLIEASIPEMNGADRVINAFLGGAGATVDTTGVMWSQQRADQAVLAIQGLIKDAYDAQRLRPEWHFHEIKLPSIHVEAMPTDVHSRLNSEFKSKRWFSGWRKGVYPIAHFDAKSTEYRLASIMDDSPGIAWWMRVYHPGDIYIELPGADRYYPDFIALDSDGTNWLIEGKSDRDATGQDAVRKRIAAEEWARFVCDDGRFGTWKYMFATETALTNSKLGWASLVAQTQSA